MAQAGGVRGIKAWHLYLAVGAVAMLAYFVPFVPASNILYNGIALSAAVAVVLGVRRNEPAHPLSWYLIAGGIFSFVVGEAVSSYYVDVLKTQMPYPSVADVFYLAGYPLFATGLAFMVRSRAPWRDDAGLIDATILAVGASVLSWVFFISPQISDTTLSFAGTLTTIAYPLADVLLLGMLVRLAFGGGSRMPSYYLLVGGTAAMVIADSVFTVLLLEGSYADGDPVDVGWMVSYLLFGAAALHPSMASLNEPVPPEETRISRHRLALLISASLTAPTVLLVQDLRGQEIDVPVIFAGSVVLFILVSSRMGTLAAELHRRRGEARFRSLVQNASDAILVLDAAGNVLYASPSVESLTGSRPDDLHGSDLLEVVHPDDEVSVKRLLTECLGEADSKARFRSSHADGSWRHLEASASDLTGDPNVRGILFTAHDVTERVALEEQLRYRAVHDGLTGLPNRELFMDRLGHALERSARYSLSTAVLFLDLDNFKMVNDSLGHEAGNELLIETAGRLGACLRSGDTVARLGGDEFTILLEDISGGVEEVRAATDRILKSLGEPFEVQDQEIYVSASVGITLNPSESASPEAMLKDADMAMYEAKARGKGCYEVFGPGMNDRVLQRLQLESEMHRALREGEFRLFYQPSIFLENGVVTGFEALVRWDHPTRGMLPPIEFIPIAEESGLIIPVGSWVLREACRQTREWQRMRPEDGPPLTISVNLSARQFQQPDLADEVAEVLEETGLASADLTLEITETVAMDGSRTSRETLQRLKDLGIKLAIDDFGTGYASLSYLQNFPVEVLKIDRSFVDRMSEDPRSASIVTTVISFANSLGLSVVAEGIETEDQLAQLKALGCPVGQGYHFSRPLPEEQARQFILSGVVG